MFETNLSQYIHPELSGRDLNELDFLITKYCMDTLNNLMGYQGYYIYENMATGPSPGFRILMLFNEDNLEGIVHSRPLEIESSISHKINDEIDVTFFKDVNMKQQSEFTLYMREWLEGVD